MPHITTTIFYFIYSWLINFILKIGWKSKFTCLRLSHEERIFVQPSIYKKLNFKFLMLPMRDQITKCNVQLTILQTNETHCRSVYTAC